MAGGLCSVLRNFTISVHDRRIGLYRLLRSFDCILRKFRYKKDIETARPLKTWPSKIERRLSTCLVVGGHT